MKNTIHKETEHPWLCVGCGNYTASLDITGKRSCAFCESPSNTTGQSYTANVQLGDYAPILEQRARARNEKIRNTLFFLLMPILAFVSMAYGVIRYNVNNVYDSRNMDRQLPFEDWSISVIDKNYYVADGYSIMGEGATLEEAMENFIKLKEEEARDNFNKLKK